jgi:hypothetical protein
MSGFSPFGSWEEFQSLVNRAGFAWKNLIGQDRVDTWTPGLSFGNGTTGITYTNQNGNFVRVGKLIVASYKIVLTSKGSSTGVARITGIAVTSGVAIANDVFMPIGYWSGMTSSLVFMSAGIDTGATTAQIFGATAAATGLAALTDADFADTSSIQGALIYYSK